VNEQRLSDALREASDEDGGARERSWRVVRAAYQAEPHPARTRRRRPWRAGAAVAAVSAVAVAGVAAASAPRSDVGRWVRSVLGAADERARPALVRVPGGGKLLVEAGDSAWVVSPNGSRRRLGSYAGASWSPRGRFVVGWRGRQLSALDDRGRTRWSLARPSPIALARWSPVDGFRIAYLSGGERGGRASLRIVNGDGTGDRRLGFALSGVAPAWRPDTSHVLASAGVRGRVAVVAVDSRLTLWRSGALDGIRELAWSPDGRRLLVLTRRGIVLFGRDGGRLRSRPLPPGTETEGARWAPDGRTVAIVRHRPRTSEVVLLNVAQGLRERTLFTGPGRFGPPAWAPDGRVLLLPWPAADQWLFLRPEGGARLQAVASIAGHFRSGPAAPVFPRSVGWCC
jgi:dipeptidyl aminopeptidase/acylaminoacyl peptidase